MPVSDIKFSRKKLKNGMELVTAPMLKNPTITAIILFKIGSRYEDEKYAGISHFLEHIVFKGNKLYRNPLELSAAVDSLGGRYNAFTSKEYTGFYIKVGAEYLDTALEWLGQLVTTPLIPDQDVEMERNVILEEINMYNDTPTAQIGYIFEELVFPGSTLGRNIIGTKKSLIGIKKSEITKHFRSNYYPSNAVLAIAGDLGELGEQKVNKYFKFLKKDGKQALEDKVGGPSPRLRLHVAKASDDGARAKRVKTFYKKTDQTHLMLGAKTFSYLDKRRYPLSVISAIMGGGMSSWAFTEIREKRGLAYYVRSSTDLYKDMGAYSIGAGLNNDKLELAVKEIMKLFKRIREKGVSAKDLKKAKDQLIGGMLLNRETSEDIATTLVSDVISYGEVTPFSEDVRIIKRINQSEIKRLAQEFFAPERLQLAMIGPWKKKDEEKFAKLLK